jgi:hypothetical protein
MVADLLCKWHSNSDLCSISQLVPTSSLELSCAVLFSVSDFCLLPDGKADEDQHNQEDTLSMPQFLFDPNFVITSSVAHLFPRGFRPFYSSVRHNSACCVFVSDCACEWAIAQSSPQPVDLLLICLDLRRRSWICSSSSGRSSPDRHRDGELRAFTAVASANDRPLNQRSHSSIWAPTKSHIRRRLRLILLLL